MATYSTTTEVKSLLQIGSTDTTQDTFIDDLRTEAQHVINSMLRGYATVPFSGSENDYNQIVLAEKFMAAGLFRTTVDEVPDEGATAKGKQMYDFGKGLIKEYIDEHYIKSKSTKAGNRNIAVQTRDAFWEV